MLLFQIGAFAKSQPVYGSSILVGLGLIVIGIVIFTWAGEDEE